MKIIIKFMNNTGYIRLLNSKNNFSFHIEIFYKL